MADMVKEIIEHGIDIGRLAKERDRNSGSPNFVSNVVLPLMDVIMERVGLPEELEQKREGHNPGGTD